jgi:hypothetical protein
VAEAPQLGGRAGDVLVDVVGLRPGERRDEADPETHGAESSRGGLRTDSSVNLLLISLD